MELGNMMFGNSRGQNPVNRNMQDEWYSYMANMGFDGYGWHEQSDDSGVFQNEVFWIKPYYWGDCTCGFDELESQWCDTHEHSSDCYQSELRQEKLAAGATIHKGGWLEQPQSLGYDEWNAVERAIMDRLCAKHGRDPKFGCAVHCTCDYELQWQAWRAANDHKEDCPIVMPNFWHKPSGFKLEWYKYPLRDSYSNQPLTRKLMRSMFADCIASMTAQGMSAGTAETQSGSGLQPASPVAASDAPIPSSHSE